MPRPLIRAAVDHLFREGLLHLGAFLRQAFWWGHCSLAGPTLTWPKPRPQSTGLADEGLAIRDIRLLRLRALLAQVHGDEARYRDYRDRYRDMAKTLGFEGHIAWAEAMPSRRMAVAVRWEPR